MVTTHISSLARLHESYCIQMVRPWVLLASLDRSTDLRHDLGDTMQEHFMELLNRKFENCTEWYLTNLSSLGIQEPLVVIIRSDGLWQMDEGHHRLAWALWQNVPEVPVIFDDSGLDDDSHMGYMVARANVDAYHHTLPDPQAELDVPDNAIAEPYVINRVDPGLRFAPPQPRAARKGRHRAGD